MSDLSCVILAAGRSTRFPAPQGKLFYPLAGMPVVGHLLHTIASCSFSQIIVVAGPHNAAQFEKLSGEFNFELVIQQQQDGTWGALQTALPVVQSERLVLLNGDQPLVSATLLNQLQQSHKPFALVSMILAQPRGYGRLVRDEQSVWVDLVEEKDLLPHQRGIQEVNAGVYLLDTARLRHWDIAPSPHTGERYLTQLWGPGGFCAQTHVIPASDHRSMQGINTWADFEEVEQSYYQIQREKLAAQGIVLQHCASVLIENADQICGSVGTHISGPAHIKGPLFCEPLVRVEPFSSVSGAQLGASTQIGPYAFVQAGVQTGPAVHLGSFVEAKRSQIGAGTKAKHLSYIADAHIGAKCNIGAFVVFCNYDGVAKHRCTLGDHVFVGSSSQLVAPLTIGQGGYIGAGTTVTHDVSPGRLITRRAPWRDRPVRKGEELCVGSSAAPAATSGQGS